MDRKEMASTDTKKFTPGGERLKSHGNLYHCQQLMLFLCKSAASGNVSFQVTCEIEEAGKFDDIVIFYERGGKTLCRLIQVKHKENILKPLTSNDLKTNSQFRLQTYFDSFVEITNVEKFQEKYGCEIDELIICTNADLANGLKKRMEIVPDSIFNEYDLYRVKLSETEFMKKFTVESDDEAREEFFRKLRFAVKQPDGEDLKDDIKREIVEFLEKEHPDDNHTSERVEMTYVSLLTKIIDFDTNPQVQIITDEGYLNWLHEAFGSGENQLSVYHRHNLCLSGMRRLRFKRESLEELEKFVMENGSCLSKVISCADTSFTVQKLIQICNLQNREFRLIFDEQVVASMWNIKRDFVSATRCEYLVVVCKSNEISKQIFKIIKDIHNKISDSNLNKRVILVSNPDTKTENYLSIYDDLAEFEDHIEWDDFDEQTKNHVLEKSIVFQGQLVSFSVIDVSYVRSLIKDRVLCDIALSDKYEIGKPFHDSKTDDLSYFVERNVRLCDTIRNPFNIFNWNHSFTISNIDETSFKKFMSSIPFEHWSRYVRLNDETAAEEFRKISRNNEDKNVSWICFEDGTFRWKKSTRSISVIKQYIETSVPREIKLETISNIDTKSVLVIGEPGMGKSTLLSLLATRSIERSPNVWIIKIDLNNHTRHFSQLLKDCKTFSYENDVIEFITDTQKFCGFEKALFESYFRIEEKLVVLLDGFDEIAPHYKNIVVDLVKILKSSDKITVWVTSRPHEKVFLEQQLDVLPYSLSEFTDEDQREFFRKFWKRYVEEANSQEDRLEMFIDRLLKAISRSLSTAYDLLLTSIPLQCKMLADVYNDDFIKFYTNETDDTGIPDTVDILDLYDRFIRIKCKINIEEKRGTDITKPENVRLLDKEIEELSSRYKLLCLSVMFGGEDEKTLLSKKSKKMIKRSLSDIENGIDKCGIVCSVENGISVFLHRTFAEYFAALYLKNFIDNANNDKIKHVAFVRSKLFEPKYAVVRRFFDRLTGTADIFKYALNGDKEQLWKKLKNNPKAIHLTDKFGRNVLHLIAGYDDTGEICNYLVESGADTTRIDELFGLKPVEYAAALKVWGNVNVLLVGNENDEKILRSIEDKEELMCIAGAGGLIRLIRYLIEVGEISANTKNKEEVSTLHFAASRGHGESCRYLIETGADIKKNLVERSYMFEILKYDIYTNETPVHVAIRKGFIEIVKLFMENDRNIIEDIRYKETLLHSAMESGNIEILRLLVDRGADVKSVNEKGETPLHMAKVDTSIAIIDFLLEHGANIEAIDHDENNPLIKYVRVGNISVTRHLLARGADIYYRTKTSGITVIHFAISFGHSNILEMFIEHDPDILNKRDFSLTLMHAAMLSNKIDIIESLIKKGADINSRNWKGRTPIHIATWNTDPEIVNTLLNHGVDIDAIDRTGHSPLIMYASVGNLSVVQLLVERGADVHQCSDYGKTALHHAAYYGSSQIVELLIGHDPTVVNDFNSFKPVLHEAMRYGIIEMIEILVKHGADVNGRNANDETPLHIAKQDTGTKIVDALLSHGANIEAMDRDGNTPLIRYAEVGNLLVVRLLAARGANVSHRSGKRTIALHHAASAGDLNMVETLIEHDPYITNDIFFSETVLQEAMKSGNLEIIESLIRQGANVNGRNSNYETPLHVAKKDTSTEIIDTLLSHGADIDTNDRSGNTPLMRYAEEGNLSVVRLLVTKGADVHHCYENGKTVLHHVVNACDLNTVEMIIAHDPTIMNDAVFSETVLHEAVRSNRIEIIVVLIKHGANVNGRNSNGETPLHIARSDTSIEIVDTLLSHGADINTTDNSGNTPLIKYVQEDNLPVVQFLVKKGANVHHCLENGMTVLHCVASKGNLKLVETLIEHDVTIMKDANVSETVLHAAMKAGKIKIIEILIRHGASVNGKNENCEVPLHIATKNTDVRIIDILLNSGTNIDATGYDGNTPLIKYIEADNFTVVEHLVALGADIRHCPVNNRTAFHHVAAIGNLKMVELFIRRDRTIVETIASANSLLHEAMKSCNINVIKLLIDHGADINGRNEKGETPLHIANSHTSIAVVKLLLEHGADVEAKDKKGKTPILKFLISENFAVIRYLWTVIDGIDTRKRKRKYIQNEKDDSETIVRFDVI